MDENAGDMYQAETYTGAVLGVCGCISGPYGGEGRGQYPDGGTAGSESLTHGPGVSAWDPCIHPRVELGAKPERKVIKRILVPGAV